MPGCRDPFRHQRRNRGAASHDWQSIESGQVAPWSQQEMARRSAFYAPLMPPQHRTFPRTSHANVLSAASAKVSYSRNSAR